MRTELAIIGGGPAGMAAALSAHEEGVSVRFWKGTGSLEAS